MTNSFTARVLVLVAAALVPWTIWVAWSLPRRHVAHRWDIAWGGFDFALILLLAIAGVAFARRKMLARTLAPAIAALLVADAWFDIMTAGDDSELWFALALAILVELPLAAFCVWVTRTVRLERA